MYREVELSANSIRNMLKLWRRVKFKIEVITIKKQKEANTDLAYIIYDNDGNEFARIKLGKHYDTFLVCYEE